MNITDLKAGPDRQLIVTADDGRVGSFDVSPYLSGPVFQPLRDRAEFLKISNGGYFIEWACGADLSADTIEARWRVFNDQDKCKVTSGYTPSKIDPLGTTNVRPHTAIDIRNPHGDPVYSILEGRVSEIGYTAESGNFVKIDHPGGIQSSYSHTGNGNLRVGDSVTKGQVVGVSDSTGRISGPHLHFVLRQNGTRVNPCGVLTCPP